MKKIKTFIAKILGHKHISLAIATTNPNFATSTVVICNPILFKFYKYKYPKHYNEKLDKVINKILEITENEGNGKKTYVRAQNVIDLLIETRDNKNI